MAEDSELRRLAADLLADLGRRVGAINEVISDKNIERVLKAFEDAYQTKHENAHEWDWQDKGTR